MTARLRLTIPVDGFHRTWVGRWFTFISLLFNLSGFAQSILHDSTKISFPVNQDTGRVDRLNDSTAFYISRSEKDLALSYADQALEAANRLNYLHGIALAYSRKSKIALHFSNDYDLAKKFGLDALRYFEQTPDKKGMDTLIYTLFTVALSEFSYEEALDYSDNLYQYATQNNNQNEIFLSLTGMFELNRQMGNYEKCFTYAQQLYNIATKSGNRTWLAGSMWNLAQLYTLIEDYPEALLYYRRVFEISDPEVKRAGILSDKEFSFKMEYAEAFSRMQEFDSAWHYYRMFKPSNDAFQSVYLISTGECYFLQGNFHQALENFNLGLNEHRKYHDVNGIMRSLFDISRVNLVLGDLHNAIHYGWQGLAIALQTRVNANLRYGYKILSDAYDQLGMKDSSNYYFRKYTVIKDVVLNEQAKVRLSAFRYEQRIEMMKKEKQIEEFQLQKETLLRYILITGIFIILIISLIVFRNIMLKRRYEARQRELAEDQLRIQVLESGKSRAEFLQQRSELELKALRAQMNPHFIFNCLNSINQFIIKNDANKAADYLTKFAKLIRLVLERSGKAFIPLEEELKCLTLYMDLEAIRFENPFVYEIFCNGMDTSTVLIPSLIIQPFVENSIWHGLHPMTGRQGKITIRLNPGSGMLHCEISDNGIGITDAWAIKGNSQGTKQSFGIELTRQRLRLVSQGQTPEPEISFRELKNEEGKNAGTCVHIDIPVKNI